MYLFVSVFVCRTCVICVACGYTHVVCNCTCVMCVSICVYVHIVVRVFCVCIVYVHVCVCVLCVSAAQYLCAFAKDEVQLFMHSVLTSIIVIDTLCLFNLAIY